MIPIAFDDSKIISHKDFVYIFRKFISGMHGENRFKNTIHMFDKKTKILHNLGDVADSIKCYDVVKFR